MRTLTLVTGLVAGYVLGTRAGREKYQQIVQGVKNLSEYPAVVRAQSTFKTAAGTPRTPVSEMTSTGYDESAARYEGASGPVPNRSSMGSEGIPL